MFWALLIIWSEQCLTWGLGWQQTHDFMGLMLWIFHVLCLTHLTQGCWLAVETLCYGLLRVLWITKHAGLIGAVLSIIIFGVKVEKLSNLLDLGNAKNINLHALWTLYYLGCGSISILVVAFKFGNIQTFLDFGDLDYIHATLCAIRVRTSNINYVHIFVETVRTTAFYKVVRDSWLYLWLSRNLGLRGILK